MKKINQYILEKFKISKDTLSNNGGYADEWYVFLSSTYYNKVLKFNKHSDKVVLTEGGSKYAFFFTKENIIKLRDYLGEECTPPKYRLYVEKKFTILSDAIDYFNKTVYDTVDKFWKVFYEIKLDKVK